MTTFRFTASKSASLAYKRLHTVSESIQGQRDQLKRAQHDGQCGSVIFVAAGCPVQVDIEDDLDGAFCQRHDKRRKAKRNDTENTPRRQAQQIRLKAEQTFSGEEKADAPYARA